MKKIISICAVFSLAISAFAAGNEGVNPPQSGVLNFSAATTLIQTNTFAFPYQSVPVVLIQGLATNGAPFTVSGITISNFVLTISASATTNASVAWQSFVGGTRMQSGSVNTGANTNVTVTFQYPYAVPPVVVAVGSQTNQTVAIPTSLITTTNFQIVTYGNSTNSWISVGPVAYPQTDYQGNFPVNNKVLY